MSNSDLAIRNKLYDFIRVADEKKLHAIYNLLQNDIDNTLEWRKDKAFTAELDPAINLLKMEQIRDILLMSRRHQ